MNTTDIKKKEITFTQTYEVELIVTALVPEEWTDEDIQNCYTDYNIGLVAEDYGRYDDNEIQTIGLDLHSVTCQEWHNITETE